MRWFGLLPFLGGLIFLGASASWCVPLASRLLESSESVPWFNLLLLLAGLPFLCVGGVALAVGVGVLLSAFSSRVEIAGGFLRYAEAWGVVRKTWTRKLADVERVVLVTRWVSPAAIRQDRPMPAAPGTAVDLLQSWAGLRIEGASMEPLWMAMGYPAPLLRDLARHLLQDAAAAGGRRPIELAEETGLLPTRPAGDASGHA